MIPTLCLIAALFLTTIPLLSACVAAGRADDRIDERGI